MAVFKCKMCGGTIEFESGATVGVCDSCGTKQTLPKTTDETIGNLFNRANNLRLKCEFDKAASIYEKIIEQDDSEAEAHWGLVLCKYGIEYVDDPATGNKIPTCHRTLFEAVTADADYQAAIDYSDAAQQNIYESEARTIDRIQKDILAIVKNEKPFDVFICYKETDENGKRTQDSVIANDIYYQLTQEGFKVFYAAITLEDKLGQEYEPYIFAALNSAKVMLVVGTNPVYFNAVWVRNEWSRYMKLMKTDRSKLLIPCYRDMDAYELPEEFAHLQAQDMCKIGFINDIIRGVKKIIKTESESYNSIKLPEKEQNTVNVTNLLKRAKIFIDNGEWIEAKEYCEKILDKDAENKEAYMLSFLAASHCKDIEGLPLTDVSILSLPEFKNALLFSSDENRQQLKEYKIKLEKKEKFDRLSSEKNQIIASNQEMNAEIDRIQRDNEEETEQLTKQKNFYIITCFIWAMGFLFYLIAVCANNMIAMGIIGVILMFASKIMMFCKVKKSLFTPWYLLGVFFVNCIMIIVRLVFVYKSIDKNTAIKSKKLENIESLKKKVYGNKTRLTEILEELKNI